MFESKLVCSIGEHDRILVNNVKVGTEVESLGKRISKSCEDKKQSLRFKTPKSLRTLEKYEAHEPQFSYSKSNKSYKKL